MPFCNKRTIITLLLTGICINTWAEDTATANATVTAEQPTVVEKKNITEEKVMANPFAITFHKENYVLPFYYTGSPYNQVYRNTTPNNESIKSTEIKYQLSLKLPLWREIFASKTSLYFAYTQLSYWQLYNKYAFFRETDYQPEVFFKTEINWPIGKTNWAFNTLNIGANHESNGFGNAQERSWNRIFIEAIAGNENMMVSLKPWYVFHDATYNKYNPNMANYLGYGEITLSYKFRKQVLTLLTHSLFDQGGRHVTGILSYSFPITTHINGYAQFFSGYGQSLIEYNHRTNSFGLGFAINNLI